MDSIPSHEAWARTLGGVHFPLLSDMHRAVVKAYGLLDPDRNTGTRAVIIVDSAGRIRLRRLYERKHVPDPADLLSALRQL